MILFKYDDRDWSWQLSCIPFPVNLLGPRGWLSQVNIPIERTGLEQLQKHVSAVPSTVQLSRLFGRLSYRYAIQLLEHVTGFPRHFIQLLNHMAVSLGTE